MNKKPAASETQIDDTLVKKVASLARLGLTEDEVSLFAQQFKHILNYFSILDEVNTEGVLPAYQISNNPSILRKDVVEPSLPLDDLMSNVPDKKNNQIAIPRVHFDE